MFWEEGHHLGDMGLAGPLPGGCDHPMEGWPQLPSKGLGKEHSATTAMQSCGILVGILAGVVLGELAGTAAMLCQDGLVLNSAQDLYLVIVQAGAAATHGQLQELMQAGASAMPNSKLESRFARQMT